MRARWFAVLVTGLVALLVPGLGSAAPVTIQLVSIDPYVNADSQHRTQVEPAMFAAGNTIVSAFQVGRAFGGGSSNIGFARSGDGGATWSSGFLPSLTVNATPAGTATRASDPSVAFDPAHNTWLISSLLIRVSGGTSITSIAVSRSPNGGQSWSAPVIVAAEEGSLAHDKNWVACDGTATSAYYGRCYTFWSDLTAPSGTVVSTSSDGGQSWGTPVGSADSAAGIGGNAIVLPNGTVIVPFVAGFNVRIIRSTNGGASFGASINVSSLSWHNQAGLRDYPIPSLAVDGGGRVYAVWSDCRFRSGCPNAANDLVLSTSSDTGATWSPTTRIPIDKTTSGISHVIPGIGADTSNSGSNAVLALTYFTYDHGCATCTLTIGFVKSTSAGKRWSRPRTLSAAMPFAWFPDTAIGRMVGDYISTVIASGKAVTVVPIAGPPAGPLFDQAMNAARIAV